MGDFSNAGCGGWDMHVGEVPADGNMVDDVESDRGLNLDGTVLTTAGTLPVRGILADETRCEVHSEVD